MVGLRMSVKEPSSFAQTQALNHSLTGRKTELERMRACVHAGRNILLEGPVGVGKTHLALALLRELKRPYFRVDGDSRYTEQKLAGWFDPPAVLKLGYTQETFMPGPLVEAMRAGGVLFINELNRLPEGVQNILLPAIDERRIQLPRLEAVEAKPGFLVIATQNPKEFVATSHLSEAILDRFEWVALDYQTEAEEREIVRARFSVSGAETGVPEWLVRAAVRLARLTRGHPRIRRGASVRAAQSVAELSLQLDSGALDTPQKGRSVFLEAALLALPTRIEIERSAGASAERDSGGSGWDHERRTLIRALVDTVFAGLDADTGDAPFGSDPSSSESTESGGKKKP